MQKDGNCKEVMRKIRQQWKNFTEEDIARLRESYEVRERKKIKKFRFYKEELKIDN